MKLISRLIQWVTILAIISVVWIITYNLYLNPSENSFVNQQSCIPDTFAVRDFVLELHLQGIQYPDVVLRQAILESGYFTSSVWKDCNNPFGFYYKGEYLAFSDWKAAITYMKEWQNRKYKDGDYYTFLDGYYAEDPLYIKKLKTINLNNLK